MKFPFVSRERLNEAKDRIAALEAANIALREQLTEARIAAATPHRNIEEPIDIDTTWQPIPGKPTIAVVMSEANKAAQKRAETPNAKGIAQELEEKQKTTFRRASGQ